MIQKTMRPAEARQWRRLTTAALLIGTLAVAAAAAAVLAFVAGHLFNGAIAG